MDGKASKSILNTYQISIWYNWIYLLFSRNRCRDLENRLEQANTVPKTKAVSTAREKPTSKQRSAKNDSLAIKSAGAGSQQNKYNDKKYHNRSHNSQQI